MGVVRVDVRAFRSNSDDDFMKTDEELTFFIQRQQATTATVFAGANIRNLD